MDMGASVLTRLKIKAKESGKPFQLYLQLFCQEEFLRRVCISKYADNLVLKGGMLIFAMTNFESRATVDIDFLLRQLPSDIAYIREVVDEIISMDTGNNFVTLSAQGFETISQQRKYRGISFQLIGQIKNTRTPFSVDIGIGDVIVPRSQKRYIPVQLADFSAPLITAYSLDSTVAEKLDALLQRLELTSRMKDIYDIYYLSNTFDFDGRQLQQAIYETLENRGTPYERDSLKKIIAFRENSDIQVRWRQYLRRTKLPGLTLDQVLTGMDVFLQPVWDAIIDQDELLKTWNAQKNEWGIV